MKQILLCSTLIIATSVLSFSQNISVKAGKVVVDKILISKTWEISNVFNVIGFDHRISDKTNKVYTYDKLGLALFEAKDEGVATGKLLEIQLYLSNTDANSITPTGYFSGGLKVENVKINAATSITVIDSKLKKYLKEAAYSAHNYRYEYKGIYIYFLFNETETGLRKISIGPDRN